MENDIYLEKQSLLRCGVHAVNNLLQKKIYSYSDFDEIISESVSGLLVSIEEDKQYVCVCKCKVFVDVWLGLFV